MRGQLVFLFTFAAACSQAVIIDRIAIVVNDSIIKQSDIERDIRVTDYLNQERFDLGEPAKKKAANRLIDQVFIRREIDVGGYSTATLQEADQQLAKLKSERYRSNILYQQSLRTYALSELDLRTQFQWQLTVLRFVDTRFRPGAVVSDDEVQKYFDQHAVELRRANPGKVTVDDFRQQIQDILAGDKVNQLFFSWLDEKRKEAKIQYREEGLQ